MKKHLGRTKRKAERPSRESSQTDSHKGREEGNGDWKGRASGTTEKVSAMPTRDPRQGGLL